MEQLQGKVALVTGGASGIGFGMVQAFLEQGLKVVICDVREDHLDRARLLVGDSDDVLLMRLDVTDREAMAQAAEAVLTRFGKLHILCNNAGVGVFSNALECTYADWDWSIDVNLTGVFNGIRTFLPLLIAHGEGGHIVNTSSVSAGLPIGLAYAASKCGVLGLTEGIAAELAGYGIGSSCLMPGPVRSNIHEVARLRPERFADTKMHAFEAELAQRESLEHWLDPIDVGRMVADAVRRDLLFIFTHNEFRDGIRNRFAAMLAAMDDAPVSEAEKALIGFPVANPIYERLLGEPPAQA